MTFIILAGKPAPPPPPPETVIIAGDTVLRPDTIEGYSSERQAATVVHPILGRTEPDVTLRPALSRTGTLTLWFYGDDAETRSREAEDTHGLPRVFTLMSTQLDTISMQYVSGRVTRSMEDQTQAAWIVNVEFTAISDTITNSLEGG